MNLTSGISRMRRVEDVGVVVLDERLRCSFQPRSMIWSVDGVARARPADEVGGQAALARDPDRALDATQHISRE